MPQDMVSRGMVNPDCQDPLPEADMEDEVWDYPGCELEEGWGGVVAPQLTPPDEASSAAPTGKPIVCSFTSTVGRQ